MRDALSLTDQAIAQTNGDINNQAAQASAWFNGHTLQPKFACCFVSTRCSGALMDEIAQVASRNPNYIALLDDLIALTHLIQLTSACPASSAT
ncbi:hypothetical protein P4S68_21225 [Pseudoalteromonas sp. Hal099]